MRRRRTGTAGGTGLRLLLLMLLLLGLSALSGCGQKSVFSLDPEEISRIAVYTGGVPADAQRKETENAGEVERIVRILNGIRVRGKASYDDVPAGGIGIWFEVLGKDGQTSVARVLGDGDLLARCFTGLRPLTRKKSGNLWMPPSRPWGRRDCLPWK